jgi:hypothetical protein
MAADPHARESSRRELVPILRRFGVSESLDDLRDPEGMFAALVAWSRVADGDPRRASLLAETGLPELLAGGERAATVQVEGVWFYGESGAAPPAP